MELKQAVTSGILGLAVGDAFGVPLEFMDPEILRQQPVTEMIGFGSHDQPAGTWSDDTSMTLALMDAMIKSSGTGAGTEAEPDYDLVMNCFENWINNAEYTAGDVVFDMGMTCCNAIQRYTEGVRPAWKCGADGLHDCGNGALMRILPAVYWLRQKYGTYFAEDPYANEVIFRLTSLTHGHERCRMASLLYLCVAGEVMNGMEKSEAVKTGLEKSMKALGMYEGFEPWLKDFSLLLSPGLSKLPAYMIHSSGYVVDTITAAVWAFLSTESYGDCIIAAANLGNDADTAAAVAGGLAGMYYGISGGKGIPYSWLGNLKKVDYISELCSSFAAQITGSAG